MFRLAQLNFPIKPTRIIETFKNYNCVFKNNGYTTVSRNGIVANLQRRCHNFPSEDVHWTTKVKQRFFTKGTIACLVLAGAIYVKVMMTSSSSCEVENQCKVLGQTTTLNEAIERGKDLALRIKDETGSPGLVIAVSCDGKQVWAEGFGFSDVENRVPCTPASVMRIASISKSITMTAVARLWESGKLDLDKRIQQYVPYFPEKMVDGEKVTITTRQLVSHLAGIRHYDKTYMNKNSTDEKKEKKSGNKTEESEKKNKKKEMEFGEYYIKDYYKSVSDGIKLFKDDPLVHKPGSNFLYTSHGWTLVSAVVEGASKQSFKDVIESLFKDLGLEHTCLDYNDVLIYNRSRYYIKDKNGRLRNAPYVDNSYKWAGGGFLSTVEDLLKFGNSMLYSFQCTPAQSGSKSGDVERKSTLKSGTDSSLLHEIKHEFDNKGLNLPDLEKKSTLKSEFDNKGLILPDFEKKSTVTVKPTDLMDEFENRSPNLPGFLKQETIKSLWTPVEKTECSWDKSGKYGMGWAVIPEKREHGQCCHQRHYVSHTGGAVGASSVLLVLPNRDSEKQEFDPPKGVVVAVIVNLVSINLNSTALKVAKLFEDVEV